MAHAHHTRRGELQGAATEAVFSSCRRHRYSLTRELSVSGARILFVLLNPSTANESRNDRTAARCRAIAANVSGGKLGAYRICNLFALISTNPGNLDSATDRGDGPQNDAAIAEACRWATRIVLAWGGGKGFIKARARKVEEIVRREFSGPLHCLGVNRTGTPKHPLYIRAETPLEEWN